MEASLISRDGGNAANAQAYYGETIVVVQNRA